VACCGGEGTYGVPLSATCGYGEYMECDNPNKYGSWDGFHPSEAAYKAIAMGPLRGTYTTFNCFPFAKKKALQLLPSPVHVQSLLSSALLWNTRSSTTYKLNYVTIYISAVTAIGTRVVSDYFFGRKYAIKDVIYGCDDFCLITEPRTVLHFMDVAQVTRCLLFYLFFF
jgi:hypothetical protein